MASWLNWHVLSSEMPVGISSNRHLLINSTFSFISSLIYFTPFLPTSTSTRQYVVRSFWGESLIGNVFGSFANPVAAAVDGWCWVVGCVKSIFIACLRLLFDFLCVLLFVSNDFSDFSFPSFHLVFLLVPRIACHPFRFGYAINRSQLVRTQKTCIFYT